MGPRWRKLLLVLTFVGFNRAQQFSGFGRRSGSLSSGLTNSIGSRFGLSSGSLSSQRGSSGAWLSSPPSSFSSSSLISGSAVPRRTLAQGNRLVLGNNLNNNVRLLQSPPQTSFSQPTFQQAQPQQIQQVHSAHQPQQTIISQPRQVISQPRQVLSQPRQVLSQPRQVLSQPQTVAAQPQQVLTQPRTIQTVQQVQSVAPAQHIAQPQQTQVAQPVRTTLTGQVQSAVQTPAAISHVQAPVQQVPGVMAAQSPMGRMGTMGSHSHMGMMSPMGMASPMGMMGAMNPMASMMGAGMGPMGMGMGMGMPFMSYDTMEDLFLDPDLPSRPMPGAAVAAAAAASRVAAVPGIPAAPALGATGPGVLPAASVPAAGQVQPQQAASAASVGLGHLSSPAAGVQAPQASVPVAQRAPMATGGASMTQMNPSVIQSALQTALSRVQQRQGVHTPAVG